MPDLKTRLRVSKDHATGRYKVWLMVRIPGGPWQVWRPEDAETLLRDAARRGTRQECQSVGEPSLTVGDLEVVEQDELELGIHGYVYSLSRGVYVNKEKRKVLTPLFIGSNSADEVRRCMAEDHGDGWKFYGTEWLSYDVRRILEKELG